MNDKFLSSIEVLKYLKPTPSRVVEEQALNVPQQF